MASPKNILFIGPYRQADGWGFASQDYLLSLLSTQHNIASAPIYLNPSASVEITNKAILEAESRYCNNYDIVIQQALPQAMICRGQVRNIGMLFLENNKLVSDSTINLNRMDEIWVTSNKEKRCLENSSVTPTVQVVSHPLPTQDIIRAQDNGQRIMFGDPMDNEYKFYFIGEYIQRKNLKDVVAAFHLEFDITEPVRLVIKTSLPGMSQTESAAKLKKDIFAIKNQLRVRKQFKDEVIITNKLTQTELYALHASCDCFVSASYGEAFCRPAAEALCMGNHVILASNIGVTEFCEEGDCSVVSCQEQPVLVEDPTYVGGLDMYNGHETWCVPSVIDLQKQMRKAFIERPKTNTQTYLNKFSYNNIGKILCQHIL